MSPVFDVLMADAPLPPVDEPAYEDEPADDESEPPYADAESEPAPVAPPLGPASDWAPPEPTWSEPDMYNYGPPADQAPARGSIGAIDALVALISLAVAFGLGYLVQDDNLTRVQDWLAPRGCTLAAGDCTFNGHDFLVAALKYSPFAVAAAASLISRIPGVGFLVAFVAQIPLLFLFGDFSVDANWPIAIAIAIFVVTDLILLLTTRSVGTGVLAGFVAGLGVAALPAVTYLRVSALDDLVKEPLLVVQYLVLPAALVLVAAILGGIIASLRRSA